jgi:hypothetical protein
MVSGYSELAATMRDLLKRGFLVGRASHAHLDVPRVKCTLQHKAMSDFGGREPPKSRVPPDSHLL